VGRPGRVRGATFKSTQSACFIVRGTPRNIPVLHVSFLGEPRDLIGTTDTKRAGEVGVPPPSPNFSPQRAPRARREPRSND
jgi:hypothetical protein